MGAIAKEAGWRWMLLVFSWTTGLAYITASVIYQVGTFFDHPVFSGLWILASIVVFIAFVIALKSIGRRSVQGNLINVLQVS